ncbi:MAG TPA: LysM peptidoglycan-binding domain-containing protein [Mycobacteriales bacterium]|nr:LysM peptidoglycan-binding domain-containing protein [Mycobacteriales bacterium]
MRRVRDRLGSTGTVVTAVLLALVVTASASGFTLYRIRSGDTLTAIAQRYHTTVARLIALNHLPGNGNLIYAGQSLKVPAQPSAKPRSAWRTVTRTYVVRPGDSLYAIAARQHVNPRTIARANHLPRSLMVIIGQRLAIPHRVHVVTSAPSTVGRPHLFSGGWVPAAPQVASIIRSTAHRWGVDPRFAQAIAWQESGFNQRWVSATGAVGAMQVEPYTGNYLSTYVVHRHLNLYNANDNATAGVALLAVLLRETHGNQAKAAAGYYQGLASVQSRGMFTDTKAYVRSVLALRNRF